MEGKDDLKEMDIKHHTCYYFDDIMTVRDIDFRDISLNTESYKNIVIYDISHKTFMSSKSWRHGFDEIAGFIIICGGIRYLVLFRHLWYDEIYDTIRSFIIEKSGITISINPYSPSQCFLKLFKKCRQLCCTNLLHRSKLVHLDGENFSENFLPKI